MMHVVTFYSFKGGVGRTMALMNVAADLVEQGRRVLVVDFDLEAPGAGTFSWFAGASATPGVLEFVSAYLETGESPDVHDYVYRVPDLERGELLFMPAGLHDESYGLRLSLADWGDLYENNNGFLLMEDLKAQWASAFAPDYVLIDSRTGHTDVAGICTRQLPDAVAILYFPNDQNLMGLKKIVGDIRSESEKKKLHFVPSNVPDLDDEDKILEVRLTQFQDELRFDEPAAVIHHNNSLSLLNQVLFVLDRPNSSLAIEYRDLTQKIQQANPEDVDGAVLFLEEAYKQLSDDKEPQATADDKLVELFSKHPKSEKVLDRLLRIWLYKGDILQCLAALDRLIDGLKSNKAEYWFRRAMLRFGDADLETTLSDARAGLQKEATYYDFRYFLNFVRRCQQTRLYVEMLLSPAFERLDEETALTLIKFMAEIKEAQPVIINELQRRYSALPEELQYPLMDPLARCRIAVGQFHEAVQLYEEYDLSVLDTPDRYNYAIAKWADTRVVDETLLKLVVDHKFESPGPNTFQCLSLAHYFLNDRESALVMANKAKLQAIRDRGDNFSGWRYCKVSMNEFLRDLESQVQMINGEEVSGEPIKPAFLENKPLSLDL